MFSDLGIDFAHIHIDLVRTLTRAERNTHILSAVGLLTRKPIAVSISNVSGENIAKTYL